MPHEPESRHAKRGDDWQLTPETRVLIHDLVRMSSHRKRAAHLQRRRASSSTELFSSRTWPAGTQRSPPLGPPRREAFPGTVVGFHDRRIMASLSDTGPDASVPT
jgi:hypothetical protein